MSFIIFGEHTQDELYVKDGFIVCPQPKLSRKTGPVRFYVSYEYNGGTSFKGEWVKGYFVPDPIIPEGYELHTMACGLQLNSHPPYATMYLAKIEKDEDDE